MNVLVGVAALLIAGTAAPDEAAQEEAQEEVADGWRFVALPILSANVDEGFGAGLVAALHRRDGGRLRDDLSLRLFATTRFVQRHELRWDGIDVLDLPLRVWTRVGLFSTVTQTFCGTGDGVTCDPAVARDEARAAGLVPGTDAFDDVVRRYYFQRFMKPFGELMLRWRVLELPAATTSTAAMTGTTATTAPKSAVRVELTGGWRGAVHIPGTFTEEGPYPHSLYANAYARGERGFSSALQAGVTIDALDDDIAPTRGFFIDASVRGSSRWIGSAWENAGGNVSMSLYSPLHTPDGEERASLVLAQRVVLDAIEGDVPVDELANTGGVRAQTAFGGQWIGRGIRDHRYIGKLKAIHQVELRSDLFTVRVFDWLVDVGASTFLDAGLVGAELDAFAARWPRVLFGGGVGLRLVFDRSIAMRLDLAASPFEEAFPSFYTPVGGSF